MALRCLEKSCIEAGAAFGLPFLLEQSVTAYDLIDSIFSRPQTWAGANVRSVTLDQLNYLRGLIAKDPEAAKARNGQGGSLVWAPAGKHKYVLTEDRTGGKRHTLTRLSNIESLRMGSLF